MGEDISRSCSAAEETIACAHPHRSGPEPWPRAGLVAEFL